MLQTKGFERLLCRLLLGGADALVPCSKQLGGGNPALSSRVRLTDRARAEWYRHAAFQC